ncbi:hypothetical protein [Psychrobacillus sp. FSL H8-0510]|uniref:hypothetical protein n=1 Tax=Psychrobacillus sp. FSL H8-0510 TaxID=2921394 RepID=UPI0030F6D989
MKWRKIGRIFNPVEYSLNYAQSPQVVVFENFIRIYFSTRTSDLSGKFLSKVAFIDMKKDMTEIIKLSKDEVIPLGNRGCFDEHGIFPINPLKVDGEIWAFTSGWSRRVSVSVNTGIGLAKSSDGGETFEKIGSGPILTANLNEPFLVADPFVRKINDQYHMWYIFGTEWKKYRDEEEPDRIYKIAHAVSNDGMNWVRDGIPIIIDVLEDESQALPTVLINSHGYHLFFCFRKSYDFRVNSENSYRMGYAFSKDGLTWTRNDEVGRIDPSKDDWDSEMICYPHIFEVDNKVYMLYNGNEFGKYGFGLAELEQ